jgi:hypothetical protein
MTEGRPIHGKDFEENMEDYIQERMTDASDSDEYAELDRTLEQELADLKALQAERSRPDARPNIDALIAEAQSRVDRVRQGSGQFQATGGVKADPEQMPPEAEARSRTTDRIRHH